MAPCTSSRFRPILRLAASLGRRHRRWLGVGLVLVLVAAVYAPTLDDYFGGDDFLVLGPVRNTGAWELVWTSIILEDDIVYWRPLVAPLYALEGWLFGLHPWPYHTVVLLLHLVNVALVGGVALVLTGRRGVALAAALLFGVHAAHTTNVAQISSTVELLAFGWYLAAVLCAARAAGLPDLLFVRRGSGSADPLGEPATGPALPLPAGPPLRRGWERAALGAFVAALLTKESTVSCAAVVTVLYVGVCLPTRRLRLRQVVAVVLPFWLLAVPYTVFAYLADTDDPSGLARYMYAPGPHVVGNLWWFLGRLAAPLAAGQGPGMPRSGHVGALVLAGAGVWLVLRGGRTERFLVLWTVIALAPLAPWRPELLIGRFTYQASAPYAMLLALGGVRAMRWVSLALPGRPPVWALGTAATLAAATLLGGLTIAQNRARTREGETYRLLVTTLRAAYPAPPPDGRIVLESNVWTGPFHALYLNAVADTLYGAGRVRIVNIAPGSPLPASAGWLRYHDGELTPVPAR
jgi:hypothetical protein